MKTMRWLLVGMVALCAVPLRPAVAVAPVCVLHNDSASLKQALANAASGSGSGTIEVEQGTYIVPSTGWEFAFVPGRDVALLGGYVPGTNCQQRQITASPNTASTNTILDGQSQNGAFIELGEGTPSSYHIPYGTLTIEGFEIRNLQDTNNGATALSISFDVQNGFTGGIVFRYNWVHNLIASGPAFSLFTAGPLYLTNNLLTKNIGAYAAYLESAEFNTAPWRIVNNTIANNTGEGLALNQSGSYVQLFNNILYANSSSDLDAIYSQVELHGDTYGTSTNSYGGNISNHGYAYAGSNPGYDTTSFHLTSGSTSINSGAAYAAVIPAQDLDGNARWVGSNPDRGAFESNVSDQAYWLVTSSADSSHASDSTVNCNPGSSKCTLREAITRANAQGPSLIAFQLGSSCGPQVIQLNSPLPDIDNFITIDGYSQPGASANTVSYSSGSALNPTSCIILEGVTASHVASALVVGGNDFNAQLNVQGITFEGFTGPAVSVSQGAYHWVHGNGFGIETDANPFVFSNGAGVLIGGGATFNTVGGNAPADINLYGRMNDASAAAITVSTTINGHFGNSVVGNLVGIDASYTTQANQGGGILVQASNDNEIYDNVVVAGALDGVSLVGANGNWLHDNEIGNLTSSDIFYASNLSNGGSGIALSAGSASNAIGVFGPNAYRIGYSNVIQNNLGPGVWIKSDAGTGNSVLGNSIGFNGPNGIGGGNLAIDTGPLGSAVSSGSDSLAMLQSYLIGLQSMLLNFIVAGNGGDRYRVDFYVANNGSCDPSGYGPAEVPIQTYEFTLPGSGMQFLSLSESLPPITAIGTTPTYITAAATDMSTGTTSQISNCVPLPNDRIFANGFESASAPAG